MTLNKTLILGPIENNTYVLYDENTRRAWIIDPAMEPAPLVDFLEKNQLVLEKVLITHGHFDHYYGLPYLQKMITTPFDVYLHPDDLPLWQSGGGASHFLRQSLEVPEPTKFFAEGMKLSLSETDLIVFHTPGHSPGSVTLYCPALKIAYCGDLIFFHGIGRTDLDGGNYANILTSIQEKIFTLPESVSLLPGHGPTTTVGEEKRSNPFF
jgi:glyoxylase-like metal-dependent hydrolase (beta-lactamase superfamily II)